MANLNYKQIIGIILIIVAALNYMNLGVISSILNQIIPIALLISGIVLLIK